MSTFAQTWRLPAFPGQKVTTLDGRRVGVITNTLDDAYLKQWVTLRERDLQERVMTVQWEGTHRTNDIYLRDLLPVGIVEDGRYTVQFSNGNTFRGNRAEMEKIMDEQIFMYEAKVRKIFAYDQEWRNFFYSQNLNRLNQLASDKGVTELQGETMVELERILKETGGKTRSGSLLNTTSFNAQTQPMINPAPYGDLSDILGEDNVESPF